MTASLNASTSVGGKLAREYGSTVIDSLWGSVVDPIGAATKILASRPELIPTMPGFTTPQFASFAPLAQIFGANAQAHLDFVAALERHRGDISDALVSGALLVGPAVANLTRIAYDLVASVPGIMAITAPEGPVAQAVAVAGRIAIAFGEAGKELADLETELNKVAQRLQAATVAALNVPLPGGSSAAQLATQELGQLVRTAQPYAEAMGIQLPPQLTALAAAPAAASGNAQAVAPVPGAPAPIDAPGGGSAAGAAAVAAAKSQLGTPYVWGGSQPGGFDCSGLTSWAYRQAGMEIPRTAESQAVGRQVSYQELQPGDLVIWDGHAAMYAGDGMMIEAGDPVQMNPLRTENVGMAFLGFWRPTG